MPIVSPRPWLLTKKYNKDSKMEYVCTVCGHVHNEETDGKFDDLPKYYNCPECGCGKEEFQAM
jgi:rubredoxin